MLSYVSILVMILLTVYGQLIFKWQTVNAGANPQGISEGVWFLLRFLMNPWVISTYAASVLASLFWMVALRQLELSYAYPFTSLAFVLVLVLSAVFFQEAMTGPKIWGVMLIVAGIIISSQG